MDEAVVLGQEAEFVEPVRDRAISPLSLAVKRAFDIVVAALALIVLAPVMLAIAIAIRIDSSGSVIFRTVRIGQGGESFRMLKFRSMGADAEERRGELEARSATNGFFKLRDDPRITRVGRWLRRSYLDELPQLVNVLRGQMSMVGPRPLPPNEDASVHGPYRHRLDLRPGITGPWQVKGSWRIPLEEMESLDYEYVKNRSLARDLWLIVRTVPCVVLRRGC